MVTIPEGYRFPPECRRRSYCRRLGASSGHELER
ncbi:unnamed protein product [Spirodela intermedia]|uniref:Uncharacterized protein n=1 Tax=Spirodela intermedia TaxID=51605 RepID=A0A7I8JB51_SPIIN|nr:unnamed protein product [Spirodela intermedia]CAA6667448.1 unnamed protein product [Spirodela intermedia]